MQSVRPLLLLLLLAPALAFKIREGRSDTTKNIQVRQINDYMYNSNLNNISSNTISAPTQNKQCLPIPGVVVEFLLAKIKLIFYYGSSISERYEVYLKDAPKLVNHLRWKKDRPMAVYSFCWLNTPYNVYSSQLVTAYHRNGGYNLVLVGWHDSGAFLQYGAAVTMVPRVGKAVAEALARLPQSVVIAHLAGHGLGAHVTGHIARNLPRRPNFIIGLDPSGPLFYQKMFGCQDPISSSDAAHVTVLHTDWGRLGSDEMTGPVDFLANDGHRPQPGCDKFDIDSFLTPKHALACSHYRAVTLFANAISNPSSVVGTQCNSYEAFKNQQCQNHTKAYLTEPTKMQGVFYFTTKDSAPLNN